MPSSPLRLRPPAADDEADLRAGHAAMAEEGFTFLLGFDPAVPWADYVASLHDIRLGRALPPRWVRSAFLVAEVDGEVVGRASIRFELNDFLAREGGHIGYGVLVAHRRRGYATEILRQSLAVLREVGVERALVTCDEGNVGSATVIERCGGVLEGHVVSESGELMRRYWIG